LDTYFGCYAYRTHKTTIERKGDFLIFGESGSGSMLFVTNEEGDFVGNVFESMPLNFIFVKDDTNNVVSMKLVANGEELMENKKLKN